MGGLPLSWRIENLRKLQRIAEGEIKIQNLGEAPSLYNSLYLARVPLKFSLP
jgi:hypothetical protein